MIDTRAYRDLARLTASVVDALQQRMQLERSAQTHGGRNERAQRAAMMKDAREASRVLEIVAEKYDFATDASRLSSAVRGAEPREQVAMLAERMSGLAKDLHFMEERQEGILEVAGFGLAASVSLHEVARLVDALLASIRKLKRIEASQETHRQFTQIEAQATSLQQEVQRLAPLRVTRSEAAREFALKKAITVAVQAFATALENDHISTSVEGSSFNVTAQFSPIAQVLANLVDNAVYWIRTKSATGEIRFVMEPKQRTLLVADSGPGIARSVLPDLFQAFVSRKSPPSGLGLYIARHYLARAGADIRVAGEDERCDLGGAQFVIDFGSSSTKDEQ